MPLHTGSHPPPTWLRPLPLEIWISFGQFSIKSAITSDTLLLEVIAVSFLLTKAGGDTQSILNLPEMKQ